MIKAAGNTEQCEILDVEPKAQCKTCLAYWDAGNVYCTCGHFLRDDTTENKKYIKSVLDLFSIPNFYIRKGRPHGHKFGNKCEGCDIVQSDHAPQAGVAQGIFHGNLIRRRDGHQVELEEELEELVERRVRRNHSRDKTQVRMHG